MTSSAPATLNRSVIVPLIRAFRLYDSRVIDWSRRPSSRAGTTKTGSSTSEISVICQDSTNITASTSTTEIRLLNTVDRVPVNALCAPSTSELIRLISAPVWVRVKNAIGCRWRCS